MGFPKPNINNRVYHYLFIALAFVLPLHGRLVPPVIALIVLNWLLEFNFKEKYNRIKKSGHRKNLLAFGLLYLLYIIGTSYSNVLYGQEGAFFDLEVKLSLLLFPLLFSTIDFQSFGKGFYNSVLGFFVVGSFFSGMLLIGFSFFEFINGTGDSSLFFYSRLSRWWHPSYLALYFAFSIATLIVRLIDKTEISKNERLLYFFLIFCFQVFIILLSSKAGILATLIMYLTIIAFLLIKRKSNYKKRIWIPLVLSISFFLSMVPFPQSYGRFISVKTAIEQKGTAQTNTHESSAARVLVWQSALEVIKSNPVFGVGTGDVKQELGKTYKTGADENYLNAHNQYIQTTMALGIIGLMVLLLSFLLPAIISFKRNYLLYLLFLVLAGFHFLVESMLERQAGVVFYAFFNSLLFYFMVMGNVLDPKKEGI